MNIRMMSLNTWAGTQGAELLNYITEQKDIIDIFLFQEIFDTITDHTGQDQNKIFQLKARLKEILTDFDCFYSANKYDSDFFGAVDFDLRFGICTFVRKNSGIVVDDIVDIWSGEPIGTFSRNESTNFITQLLRLDINGNKVALMNHHGVWIPGQGKDEHPIRDQVHNVFMRTLDCIQEPIIFVGDFNLNPDTRYIQELRGRGLRDLIQEYGIQSTRSRLYSHYDKGAFAGYVFASPQLEVGELEVPYLEVSDHLPLIFTYSNERNHTMD